MYKIGDFAKISRVPVKTLRYYDEIGLLKPDVVNRYNRYRYYSEGQLPLLHHILELKRLGFSLEQVACLLDGDPPAEHLEQMLEMRRQEIIEQMDVSRAQLAEVEARIRQIRQKEGRYRMEPKIVSEAKFMVVGMPYLGRNEHGEVTALWPVFNRRVQEIRYIAPDCQAAYGVCLPNQEGLLDYIAAMPVSSLSDIPQGMVGREIPAQTYAVFECRGIKEIGATYRHILNDWMPASGYKPADGPDFEYYPQDFDPQKAEDSLLYIYFPIRK
jgi:predicted transcriptional regulator YdeE